MSIRGSTCSAAGQPGAGASSWPSSGGSGQRGVSAATVTGLPRRPRLASPPERVGAPSQGDAFDESQATAGLGIVLHRARRWPGGALLDDGHPYAVHSLLPASSPPSRPSATPLAVRNPVHQTQRRARLPRLRSGTAQRAVVPRRYRARHTRRFPPHPRHRTRPLWPRSLCPPDRGLGYERARFRPPGSRPCSHIRRGPRIRTLLRRRLRLLSSSTPVLWPAHGRQRHCGSRDSNRRRLAVLLAAWSGTHQTLIGRRWWLSSWQFACGEVELFQRGLLRGEVLGVAGGL